MLSNEIIVRGNPNIPNIALTFDDGPGRVTPCILDVLRIIILCHDGHSGTYEANFGVVSALD